jgi:stearoyl-CoA desaturase (delta-9 desaturase)
VSEARKTDVTWRAETTSETFERLRNCSGYHRLWAHRAYCGSPTLKILLALLGAGSIQGSIKFWVREHRAHHRFTDTDKDPHNIREGFWHAHILWTILEQPKRDNRVDISDLKHDGVVTWQHDNYVALALGMGWLFPAAVAGIGWRDWYGGFIYGGIIRTFLVNQATFCVNSLAHYLGDQPYDDRRTPRNHLITAIITLGEGYHNFHHEFPSDYRNGIEWHQLDPTKWMIWLCSWFGLAYDLKRFRHTEIEKGRIQQSRKRLDERGSKLDWGTPIAQLPIIEWEDYRRRVAEGEMLLLLEGVVHEVSRFWQEHPGGKAFITSNLGGDATALFNGGVYNHSNAARNILATMRVAVLIGGVEVEERKSQAS